MRTGAPQARPFVAVLLYSYRGLVFYHPQLYSVNVFQLNAMITLGFMLLWIKYTSLITKQSISSISFQKELLFIFIVY